MHSKPPIDRWTVFKIVLWALIARNLYVFVGGQVVGWAIQLVGHRIEGNRPVLFERPTAFLMGPLMVLVEMLDLVGIRFPFVRAARRLAAP